MPTRSVDLLRRRLLRAFAAGMPLALLLRDLRAAGRVPAAQGMARVEGQVLVNGTPAVVGTLVRPGDTVSTGPASTAVFVVGKDAFLIRDSSSVTFSGGGAVVEGLRMLTGKLLSVFGPGAREFRTATATIGIRGTGIYVESEEQRSYVCTCYGEVELQALNMQETREVVRTRHHEAPRYIHAEGAGRLIKPIEKAPVINHTDQELILLEDLVGRTPPFYTAGYQPGQY